MNFMGSGIIKKWFISMPLAAVHHDLQATACKVMIPCKQPRCGSCELVQRCTFLKMLNHDEVSFKLQFLEVHNKKILKKLKSDFFLKNAICFDMYLCDLFP